VRYRRFGRTGLQVSELGFGTWGLGGTSYGPVDDHTSLQALYQAFDSGINFYDTSDLYGDGHSEEVLGRAFRGRREEVIIATKGGLLPHTGFYMPQDFSIAYLERALGDSLRRLATDYVDLYQLHSPALDEVDLDGVIAFLQKKKDQGVIRFIGISVRSPEDGKRVVTRYPIDAVQVNYNLIDQRAYENGLLSLCDRQGVGVIVRTPLCFGFLTGRFTGDERFQPPDHRANWPREQIRRWAQAPALFAPLNAGTSRTLVQLALQFCLWDPRVSTVIPGMMTPAEVMENVALYQVRQLDHQDIARIRRIYRTHTFYDQTIKRSIRRGEPEVATACTGP
jgi:aryl-alcohol dehydrogenase-like predicted oxidoreductase